MGNKYLSDSDLAKEVERYIYEEGYNYATLIDGGVGMWKNIFYQTYSIKRT